MVGHVDGLTLLCSTICFMWEFAAYPRVGRYAMRPIALRAKAGVPLTTRFTRMGTLQFKGVSKAIGIGRASICLSRRNVITVNVTEREGCTSTINRHFASRQTWIQFERIHLLIR